MGGWMQNRMTSLSAPPNFTLCELRIQLSRLTVKRRVVLIISSPPFSRLALICTVLSGLFFFTKPACAGWRLWHMATNGMHQWHAGRRARGIFPSFLRACQALLKLESHPEQQSRISLPTGISMRANHTGWKNTNTLCWICSVGHTG